MILDLQVLIQHQPLLCSVRIQVEHSSPVEDRVCVMDNAVMIGTYDHLIAGIVIETVYLLVNASCYVLILPKWIVQGNALYIAQNRFQIQLCCYVTQQIWL